MEGWNPARGSHERLPKLPPPPPLPRQPPGRGGRLTLMSSQIFLRILKCALSSLTVPATLSLRKYVELLIICWECGTLLRHECHFSETALSLAFIDLL